MSWVAQKLRRRLFLLVGVPMLVQILFSIYFLSEFIHYEKIAEQQAISKEIIGSTNWLNLLIVASTLTWVQYVTTGQSQFHDRLRQERHAIATELISLRESLARSNDKKSDNHLEQAIHSYLEASKTQLLPRNGEADSIGTLRLIKEQLCSPSMNMAATQLKEARRELLEGQRNSHKHFFALSPDSRNNLLFLSIALVAINVISLLFLLVGYSRYLEQRLRYLAENTKRIANDIKLLQPLTGSDELTQIDHAMREMLNELNQAKAREKASLQIKQDLMDVVTHDLKTPLCSLLGIFEIAAEKIEDKELLESLVGRGTRIARRMLSLAQDLLLIEKAEAGMLSIECHIVDLNSLLTDLINLVQPLAQKNDIVIKVEKSNVSIMCDPERILQVLTNLTSNAIKFSPAKSTISITTEISKAGATINIHDEGRGIPEEQIPYIFDRYKQVLSADSAAGRGVGLGLAICKLIIELHNGTIKCSSKYGAGTTFTIFLPIKSQIEPIQS